MAIRPGRCYRRIHKPYTRVSISVPRKSYVVGVPASKIAQFEMGAKKAAFKKRLNLVAQHGVQIRSNALEAARQAANKYLEKKLSTENYFLKVLVFPYHVLRENALATGAGADRFQEGMRKNFGKPIGIAAQVDKGQNILELRLNEANVAHGKEAFRRAASKLPTPCRTVETAVAA